MKDMLKQLEKEAAEDEEVYDKMACWRFLLYQRRGYVMIVFMPCLRAMFRKLNEMHCSLGGFVMRHMLPLRCVLRCAPCLILL